MAEEFNECCQANEAANQGFFARGTRTPQLRHKEAGAFLANVSIKALFERLPQFGGTIDTLTPDKVKEVFYECRKDAISMGIHWKLWPLLYRKIKGMSPHIETIANTC